MSQFRRRRVAIPLCVCLLVTAGVANAAETALQEHDIDPLTGLSANPEDWYVEAPPRTVDVPVLAEDLAALYYQTYEVASGVCPGEYVVRDYPHDIGIDNESQPIVAEADRLTATADSDAELFGDVRIEQGNRLLISPQADINTVSQRARFPLGVRIDQPGVVMQGERAEVELNTQEAQLNAVQFLLTDASIRGRAAQINQNADGDLVLRRNAFSRCNPGNNGWLLSASRLTVRDDDIFATARNAVLRMKSVPVFYIPYLRFPVSDDRVSGFLFPNLSYSDEDGLDLAVPYYLNLAPNYDATIIPRFISERGPVFQGEGRHLSEWQNTIVSGAFLPEDDLFNGTSDREDFEDLGGEAALGPFDPADRWLVGIDHRGSAGRFSTIVDYTAVSDRDYFRDLGADLGVSSRIQLERRGEVHYQSGGLFARLWAQRFDRLDEVTVDAYQRLPELEVTYATPLLGRLGLNFVSTVTDFERDTDGLAGLAAVTGSRAHIEPHLQLPLSASYGFANFDVGLRYTAYNLDQDSGAAGFQLTDNSPDRSIGVASFDGGLIFDRPLNWFGNNLIQTLEPRLYYLWQEFEDQSELPLFDTSPLTFSYLQLFRSNRFTGLDRFGDANQLSAGLTTRFLAADTGQELFRVSAGEIFFFDDRQVTLAGPPAVEDRRGNSAFAAEAAAAIGGQWRFTSNIVWDPTDREVDEGGASLQYRRDNRHIVNIGFRNRRVSDVEQTDLSVYWPITPRVSILARWNYDLVSKRTIEGFGGLEFNDCCLQLRLIARRFLDSPTSSNFEMIEPDDGVFLQIVFKGLAGFGTQVESVLQRGIPGYVSPQANDFFNN